jgi:hypothetical protein
MTLTIALEVRETLSESSAFYSVESYSGSVVDSSCWSSPSVYFSKRCLDSASFYINACTFVLFGSKASSEFESSVSSSSSSGWLDYYSTTGATEA